MKRFIFKLGNNSILLYISQVNNRYVLNKVALILYPMSHKHWTRITSDDSNKSMESSTSIVSDT